MRHDLAHLISPVSCETFFGESWEKKPLVIERGEGSHFAELLSLRDLDKIIAYSQPIFADENAFRTDPPPRSTFVRGLLPDQSSPSPSPNPGIAELRQVFDQGKSVVIMGMQQRWPAVAELCRNLEAVFHCPVHANMYLTPPGSQGFAAHYDPHEVFVLQLEGVKHWHLYDRTELLPLGADNSRIPAASLGGARELCLNPGDLLYIPRGHVHDAHTADSFSMHLTVGINVYRWADLLHHALTRASQTESLFRASIPGGALPEESAGLKQTFRQLLALLSDSAEGDELFDAALVSLGNQFFGQLKMLPGTQFSSPVDLDQIEIDSLLEKNNQAICRVLRNDEGVAIEFPGNRVAGPHRIEQALRFIAGTEKFAVKELPGELNAQAKVVLARRLIHEGLLTPVTKSRATESSETRSSTAQRLVHPEDMVENKNERSGNPVTSGDVVANEGRRIPEEITGLAGARMR